ncbi:serine peptidase, clan SB, family S8-like protein [Leishmania infantum JPCM5]|uniref:Subtilisin-like serine peptidase n=2 Tax=Leishmania infantum TaxID=5671 RepID=A4I3W8_LEIIN|nr:serine peptidase, clan SB, family S8-like protein [Leishmania infantum JPCM5]CAC9504940.1 subtilisin-like_serine_peptidase [Leishmania infantum]CAM69475.1 serine peptidase, clan SB, family S8-like protein [Leishmania infantum JPCM5]SUZ43418.1 subtilisin-like_serine_peptidase [Leishmania infantum]|eukprot:XP_001470280.1 serine peptidase, clan SB, family S8-like protein [Leishmania infantum JPCM5]
MRIFSSRQKVYTTGTAPVNTSEDVGVEGKRYPTHTLGRFIVQYPAPMLLTLVLPFVFFVIGGAKLQSGLSYSLDDYQIRSTIGVRRDALRVNGVLNDWAYSLSGAYWLSDSVDLSHPRTYVQDTLELRAVINLQDLMEYAKKVGWSPETRDAYANLLNPDLFKIYRAAEEHVTELDGYEGVCFTNDLRNGQINSIYPTCTPVSSVTQYIYPSWNGLEWFMNGSGTVFQLDYMQRLFANPSYGWFFDNNFSTLNQRALQLRSQYTFASSWSESKASYRNRMKRFLPRAMNFVNSGQAASLPFVEFYLGGGSSQDILMEIAGEREGYKVGVAAVICFLLSWWHCRTFIVGVYTAAEAVFAYMTAVGLYALIYRTLPLATYSAIIWVMTFCMHGTLSFYDMFVFSGVMATKGRQNNLSVVQRLCFTMRRISVGVWIADALAIIIFAVNTTSLFRSVEQFSVFMIIALLWNMYCIALPTPALIVVHHLYFSNKRRNLQKQSDVLNDALLGCRRSGHLVRVLEAVQDNIAHGEHAYRMEEDLAHQRIGEDFGIHRKRYGGPLDFVRQQVREGLDKVRAARRDVVGALHKAQKAKDRVVKGTDTRDGMGLPSFSLQDFLQIGDANPLAEETGVGPDRLPLYYNPRMVLPSDLVHIPAVYVERSEDCWSGMCDALGIHARTSHGEVIPPRAYSLRNQGTSSAEASAFADWWRELGTRLGVETASNNRSVELVSLAVRNAVRAQDPTMVVDPCARARRGTKKGGAAAAAGGGASPRATGGPSGMGLGKLRYRLAHRADLPRVECCGLFGRVADETAEQRMRRLMARKVKRDGYSLFELFVLQYYLPAIHYVRYALLALLLVLFIVVCMLGCRITVAGLPNTLLVDQGSIADTFAAMEDTFGQRGSCTFCGPYYRSPQDYRQATITDIAACSADYGEQMNLYADSCGVCNGTDACVDCGGTAHGAAALNDCGGCAVAGSSAVAPCTCPLTRDCQYCEWALGKGNAGGGSCSVTCDASTCGRNGECDQYTGTCVCDAGFTGAACNECESWLLPAASNPGCALECNAAMNSAACDCDASSGRCRSCPAGTRGYDCSQPSVDCSSHGTFNPATATCTCSSGWTGASCNVSSVCNGRGVLLSAMDSPTGSEMCGCLGHWRGGTCQLCDCTNGGMCNAVTGKCECVGAFTGPRCETCAANCTLRGTCPDVSTPDYALWNVRACIPNACSEADVQSETMCPACSPTQMVPVGVCKAASKESCMAMPDCWWYMDGNVVPYCGMARQVSDFTALSCTCRYPKVWSGPTCGSCPAPAGATCLDDGTVLGCNRLAYTSLSSVVSIDSCGVCGGDGLCRGCDGVPGSGATYDACGVCGGNNTCSGTTAVMPMYVEYLFDLTKVPRTLNNAAWCKVVASIAANIRRSDSTGSQMRTVLEDYLADDASYELTSLQDFYNYAKENGRLSEAVFTLSYNGEPLMLQQILYRVESTLATSQSSPSRVVAAYYWISRDIIAPFRSLAQASGITVYYTSTLFQPAVARVGALQSLWFAVGIGLAVTFVLLLTYYVSLTTAVAATIVAAIVCFGSLTVCAVFDWEMDAVLQVCISCTVPISVEYVVHFCSGYFDYLQTTTSHLFARDVTRRTAVQGALLRSAPAVCTSAVCVIVVSAMFGVSSLVPLRRAGQVSITLHLLLLLAGVLFTGAVAALGPMNVYQHWTLSAAICIVCAALAALAVLIMYGVHGVLGPHGNMILTR